MIAYPVRSIRYLKNKSPSLAQRVRSDYVESSAFVSAGPETFFGYYDIHPDNGSHYLFHKIDTDQSTSIRKRSLGKEEKTEVIGTTQSWSYQQGAMAQWLPDGNTVAFNCDENGTLGARLVSAGQSSFHPYPVELVADDGWFSINFKRLTHSEYGYERPEQAANFKIDQAREEDGIWFFELASKKATLIVRLSDLDRNVAGIKAEFINHLSLSRGGRHLIFIHRLITSTGRRSRLYLHDRINKTTTLILDEGFVSHYCWSSGETFVIYAKIQGKKGYFQYNVDSGQFASFADGRLDGFGDGHPTTSPDGRYLLTDTYPDKENFRHLILFDTTTGKLTTIASFWVPFMFFDYRRCDLHPRWSRNGDYLFFDSAHTGQRGLYHVEFNKILDGIA